MVWITGDYHRVIEDLKARCQTSGVQPGDTVIVAGDDCTNYYLDTSDSIIKQKLQDMGIEFFFVHGNHQCRPENISTYKIKLYRGASVYVEDDYPNLNFAIDGLIYDFDGKSLAVCGGAYSVDKHIRSLQGALSSIHSWIPEKDLVWMNDKLKDFNSITKDDVKKMDKLSKHIPAFYSHWWFDEQPSMFNRKTMINNLEQRGWKVDYVITHTCPLRYEPTEMFLEMYNQQIVDRRTEKWLNKVEKLLKYNVWYAGHFHTDKVVNGKFQFLFKSMIPLGELTEQKEN